VVTHRQGQLVHRLLQDVEEKCDHERIQVILTVNIDEALPFNLADFSYPITIINNEQIKGFAANHNYAFSLSISKYFCVLNPDIRMIDDPFGRLVHCLEEPMSGIVAPLVYNSGPDLEDNARRLPTPGRIIHRLIKRNLEYESTGEIVEVDWVAGMFLLFKAEDFQALKGFDERYFLYCEDIDICSRTWLMGKRVLWVNEVKVIHDAQRESRKNLKYLMMHLSSYIILFSSAVYYKRLRQKRRK
jgi:N-acetylglucosaminyl-diphospho-decaprenol L-rhamnosyltransferase